MVTVGRPPICLKITFHNVCTKCMMEVKGLNHLAAVRSDLDGACDKIKPVEGLRDIECL